MSSQKFKAILSGTLLCFGTMAASAAEVTASSSMHSFLFRVTDLDPTDGIDPAVSFASGTRWWIDAHANDYHNWGLNSDRKEGALGVQDGALDISTHGANAQGYVSGGLLGALTLMTSARASTDQDTSSGAGFRLLFSLTPNTLLTVSAVAKQGAAAALPGESAGALYDLHMRGEEGGTGYYDKWQSSYEILMPNPDPILLSLSQEFSITLSSAGRGAVTGTLDVTVDAFASGMSSHTPPIPEPNTSMLLSLGLVGLLASSRRSKQLR